MWRCSFPEAAAAMPVSRLRHTGSVSWKYSTRRSWRSLRMADEQLGRLLLRFRLAAQEHAVAVEAMDEGMANREATIIARLYQAIAAKGEEGKKELLALTWSDDDAVAGMAAVYSLREYP